MNPRVLYYYREFRRHGCTAEAAYNSARAHLFFLERQRVEALTFKRRSKAAKAAWKRRKQL